jgi:hypothetical protein
MSVSLILLQANRIKILTACVCLSVCQLSKRCNEVEFFNAIRRLIPSIFLQLHGEI